MQTPEVENYLAAGLDLMGVSLAGKQEAIGRLALYFQELKKWNRKVNLISRTLDDRQVLENHFLDSLSLLMFFPEEKQKDETVLDVGTGGGFPGLVLKCVLPKLFVTLVEPRKNRFYFLKHVARTLGLNEVELLNVRLEPGAEEGELGGRKFSFITSRAFTDTEGFVGLCAPYLEPGGRIVCMKGPGAAEEVCSLPGNFLIAEETKKLSLPFSKAERKLVVIKAEN